MATKQGHPYTHAADQAVFMAMADEKRMDLKGFGAATAAGDEACIVLTKETQRAQGTPDPLDRSSYLRKEGGTWKVDLTREIGRSLAGAEMIPAGDLREHVQRLQGFFHK
jgi:hypothetical protein